MEKKSRNFVTYIAEINKIDVITSYHQGPANIAYTVLARRKVYVFYTA